MNINQPNGLAGLDSNGNITSNINNDNIISSGGNASGVFPETPTYAGIEKSSPIITHGYGEPQNSYGNWDVPWDSNTLGLNWNSISMYGGHHADDKAFHWVFGQPVSGGLGAVVDFVAMNAMSAGQGTGVTAGGWNGLINYGELDAVAREEKTGSAPPKFIASAAIKDPDGISHTVTFTKNGALFSPGLPLYWSKMIQVGMNVVTNEVAISKNKLWQNNWLMPWLTNTGGNSTFYQTPNTWMGTISSWETDKDNKVISITLDTGWAVYNQNTYGLGNTSYNIIPGEATIDNSPVGLDTTYSNISSAAIMFGVYTKAFPNYQICELDPMDGKRGDINNPNGSYGNQVHQCANEWDFWNENTIDYMGTLQGLSLDFNSQSLLTNDSYGILISGGGKLPMGYVVSNMLGNAPAFYSTGKYGLVSALFSYDDLATNIGSYQELLNLGFATRPGQNYTGKLSIFQVRDSKLQDSPDAILNSQTQSIRIQYNDAGGNNNATALTQNPWDPANGAMGGTIVFNPTILNSSFFHGIGIGAGGNYLQPNYGLIVDNAGNVYIGKTGNLNFIDTNGTNIGGFSYNTNYSLLYENIPIEFTRTVNIDANSPGLTVYNTITTGSLNVSSKSNFSGVSKFNDTIIIPYGTPTKGSSCTNGQIMADDTNNYTCRNSLWTYLPKGSNW